MKWIQWILAVVIISLPASAQVHFNEHTVTTEFAGTMSALAADFDGDGDLDVVGAAYNVNEVAWYEQVDSLQFTEHIISTNFMGVRTIYPVDLDMDGDIDITGAAYTEGSIRWWENEGSGSFTEHTVDTNCIKAHSIIGADFDNDGDIDLIACAYDTSGYFWYENDGSQQFTYHQVSGSGPATYVQLFDIDQDGDDDILGTQYATNGNIIYFERTDSLSFTEHLIPFPAAHWSGCADLDGDGDNDLLGAACGTNISWFENDGSQNFTQHTISQFGDINCASCIQPADIDLDGDIDIVMCAEQSRVVKWFENDGAGNFSGHDIRTGLNGASDVNIYDFEGDGDLDIICAARFAGEILLFENTAVDSSYIYDYDGNRYGTIKIGNQIWMKENLKSLHYSDGTEIPDVYSYNDSDSLAEIYGRFYTWDAAMYYTTEPGTQGVCPCGWHIPTHDEWTVLGEYLGGNSVAGGKMKVPGTEHWNAPNTGATNESGFSALGAGEWDNQYQFFHNAAVIWSSTQQGLLNAYYRVLSYDNDDLAIYVWRKTLAYSVRCVKDTQSTTGVGTELQLPDNYKLMQNYPNPFNPSTTIQFSLPAAADVELSVFNALGQRVAVLENGYLPAGEYERNFDASALPSGIYYYTLRANNFFEARNMIFLK